MSKQTAFELMSPKEAAKELAKEIQRGNMTADQASRQLISRLSYYRGERIPSYSAKYIEACSDILYSAEMRSPAYKDTATEEAERILRDALREVMV